MTILIRGQTVELLLNGVPIALVSGFDTSFGYELTETPLLQKGHKHIDLSTFAAELSFNQLTVDAETMALALGYTEYTVDGKIKIIDTTLSSLVEGRQIDHTVADTKTCDGAVPSTFTQTLPVQGDRIRNMMLYFNSSIGAGTAALKIENDNVAPDDTVYILNADLILHPNAWYRYTLYDDAGGITVGKMSMKSGQIVGDTATFKFSSNGATTGYNFGGDGTNLAYVMLFETDSHYTFKVKYLDQNGAVSFYLLIGDCTFNKDSISGTPGEPIIEDVTGIALDVEVGE